MKGVIVYKTKYGSTKQYAEWLKEETGFKMHSVQEVSDDDLKKADIVVVGSYVFNRKPKIAPWIKKNWSLLKDKKVILYTTSGSVATDKRLQKGLAKAFPKKLQNVIKIFPLGGRLLYKNLTWWDHILMKMIVMVVRDPETKERMKKDIDNVKKEEIKNVLEAIGKIT